MTILEEEKLRVEYLLSKIKEKGLSPRSLRTSNTLSVESYTNGVSAISNMRLNTAYKVAQLLDITIEDIYTAGGKIQ